MIITEKKLVIEDTDVLTKHYPYRSANLRTWQHTYDEHTNQNFLDAISKRGLRLDNHEIFVFGDVAIRYTDCRINVGKAEDVYKGGW